MSRPLINIYMVSLKQSVKRREVQARQFHRHFPLFSIVDAIDGKMLDAKIYFSYLSKYYLRTKKIITPSELGCTLSHIRTLETFLLSNATHAIILEDDVIGSDDLLDRAKSLIHKIPTNGILLLGCQDGLRSRRWLYGKCLLGTNIYKLSKFSYQYVYRTCAYLVTKQSAKSILNRLKHVTLADEWTYLLKDNIYLYFLEVFSHPIELKDSTIEMERVIFRKKQLIGRLFNFAFYKRNIALLFLVIFALFSGLRKIKKSNILLDFKDKS